MTTWKRLLQSCILTTTADNRGKHQVELQLVDKNMMKTIKVATKLCDALLVALLAMDVIVVDCVMEDMLDVMETMLTISVMPTSLNAFVNEVNAADEVALFKLFAMTDGEAFGSKWIT